MRKVANTKTILAMAMTLGLATVGFGQNSQSTTSSSSSTTDTTTTSTNTGTTDQSRSRAMGGSAMMSDSDSAFVKKAADGGLTEVRLAQLVQQKGSSQAVKDFAHMLEVDHSNANQQLMSVASQRGMELPTTPMMSEHQTMIDKLSNLSGTDLDKAYIRMMVRDHRKDIRDFEHESSTGTDSAVKTFASSTLPTLQKHLQAAEQIQSTGTMSSALMNSSDESTRSRTVTTDESNGNVKVRTKKDGTVVESDKTTINKFTPAPSTVTKTQSDSTTVGADGTVTDTHTTTNDTTVQPH